MREEVYEFLNKQVEAMALWEDLYVYSYLINDQELGISENIVNNNQYIITFLKTKPSIKYVAEYLRKSRGESLEDLIKHKTVLEELCQRRGWVYIAYEEIETGESLYARPVMQQLLKDIDSGMFDAVVCVDLDRLGRGTLGEWDEIKRIFQSD